MFTNELVTLETVYAYITQFRMIVLDGVFPDVRLVFYGFVVSLIMLLIGTLIFMRDRAIDRYASPVGL